MFSTRSGLTGISKKILFPLFTVLLLCFAKAASATVTYLSFQANPTSATVPYGGKLAVTVYAGAWGSGRYESVYRVELMEGSTVLATQEFEINLDDYDRTKNESRSIQMTVQLSKGTHVLYLRGTSTDATTNSGTVTVTVNEPVNMSRYVQTNTSLPATVEAGTTYPYEVVMQNNGTTTWIAGGANPYRLSSENPHGNFNWGTNRLAIPYDVGPGGQVAIRSNLTAPIATGAYNLQWHMLTEGVEWFGEFTPNQVVNVVQTKPNLAFTGPGEASCTAVSSSCTINFSGNGSAVSGFAMSSLELFEGSSRFGSGTNTVSGTITLGVGDHTIELRGRDSRGVQNSIYRTYSILPPVPTASLSSPANNSTFQIASGTTYPITLAGTSVAASPAYFVKAVVNHTEVGIRTTSYNVAGGNFGLPLNLAPGNHTLQLVVTDSYQRTSSSNVLNYTVKPALGAGSSETPIPVVVSVPHSTNEIAGTLPGNLNVGNDGSASYNVEVAVPPGSAGMQPRLSLNYSSNGSNGMVGLGWSLGGLSSIHRCAKTIAQDSFAGRISIDMTDRLCLDGTRLVRSSGNNQVDSDYWAANATYRTEIEDFSRITRLAGGGFKVEGKDGKVYYYGIDKGRINAVGKPGEVLVWALDRTEDRSGNYMTVDYNQDGSTGEYTPKQIVYGGNTNASQAPDLAVRFAYEGRADEQFQYMGGVRNDLRTRLTHIRTYINTAADGSGGTLARDLEVHYTSSTNSRRSLVEWMQVSATNPATGQVESLPKTSFSWGDGGAPALVQRGEMFTLDVGVNPEEAPIKTYIGDYDGSGKSTIIVPQQGSRIDQNCYSDACLLRPFTGRLYGRTSSGSPYLFVQLTLPGTGERFTEILTGDLNGDSKDDLVLVDVLARKWAYCLAKAPNGINPAFEPCKVGGTLPAARGTFEDPWDLPSLFSLRSDGRSQLLYFNDSNQATACSVTPMGTVACEAIPTNAPAGSRLKGATSIALSKQGMSDLYSIWNWDTNQTSGISICRMTASGLTCDNLETLVSGKFAAGMGAADLNGDGLTDLVYFGGSMSGSSGSTKRCLSTETGVTCQPTAVTAATSDFGASGFGYFFSGVGDHTGDGVNRYWGYGQSIRANKLCNLAGNTEMCQDVNLSTLPGATASFLEQGAGETYSRPFVIDHSGVPSSLNCTTTPMPDSSWHWYQTCWITSVASPAMQDKLVSVVNGVGYREEVDYARGDDGGVYSRYTSSAQGTPVLPLYPMMSTSPGVVAKQLRRSNGQGAMLATDYHYEGAMRDAEGRGALGFALVRATDVQSGLVTTTVLRQDYPFTGMASTVQKKIGGCTLADSSNVLQQQAFGMPDGKQLRFPFVAQSTSVTRDIDLSTGSCYDLATITTANQYSDGWGNLNVQTVTTAGAGKSFSTVSATDFMIGPGVNYLSGLPVTQTVSKSVNGGAPLSRTMSYVNDAATALRSSETIEPNDPALKLVNTFDRSTNQFGLLGKQVQSWSDPACSDPAWPEAGCVASRTRTLSDTTFTKGRFPSTVKNAAGHTETHGYDAATGMRTSLKGPNNLTTSWNVDGFGRVTKELRVDGGETRTSFKKCAADCPPYATVIKIVEQYNGNDRTASPQITYLDSAGHVVRTLGWGFDGRQVYVDQRYDSLGRLFETDQPRFAVKKAGETQDPITYLASRMEYDALSRVVRQITKAEGGADAISTTQYQGLTTRLKNPLLQERVEWRNVAGQLEKVTDPNSKNTLFEYEQFGNLAKTTDPNGNEIIVGYDRLGRKTQLNDPDLGIIKYFVDPLGQTWAQQSPKQAAAGKKTYLVFDLLGRMTARYESDSTGKFESHSVYDSAAMGIGQLSEAYTGTLAAKDYRRLHTYDSKGRPDVTTQLIQNSQFTSKARYDAWGRPISSDYQRDADGVKSYGMRYNAFGYLERIERGSLVLWRATEQDAAARITAATLGNGLTQTRTYDSFSGRMSGALLATGAGGKRLEEGYAYDLIGSVKTRTQGWDTGSFVEMFDYDGLNRLTKSTVTGKPEQVFTYDDAGNMTSKTGLGAFSLRPQGPGKALPHAVLSIAGIAGTFIYDANGNLISGAGRVTCWNSFDMPTKITVGGNVADCSGGTASSSFTYGTEHQRTRQVRSDGTTIVYAGAQEVEQSASGTTVKTYWPNGLGVEIDRPNVSASELSWTHVDRLGSIVGLTDGAGVLRDKLEYDAWGKRRSTNDHTSLDNDIEGIKDNKGFTGHEMLEKLDLVHMNGRVYDPLVGKFLSGDPVITDPMNGQRYNRYSYVLNNPTNLTDPTGFVEEPPPTPETGGIGSKNGWVQCVAGNCGGDSESTNGEPGNTSGGEKDPKRLGDKGKASNRVSANNFTSPTSGGGTAGGTPGENYDRDGNYSGPRGKRADDRSFEIGEKTFVLKGGTADQQAEAESATRELMKTPLGKEKILPALEARRFLWFFKVDEVIDMRNVRNNAYVSPFDRDVIHIDPYFRPRIDTTIGPIFSDFRRTLWHEFGHSALGIDDNNYMNMRRMENVIKVENPLMRYIGQPERVRYDAK